MLRWATTLVGLAAVVLAIGLAARGFRPPQAIGRDPSSSGDAGTGGERAPSRGLEDAAPTGAWADDAGPLLLSDLLQSEVERRGDGGSGAKLADGAPVPSLPASVPRQVRFGVVLVSYTRAQPSVTGGRPSGRSRDEAKALADRLLTTAVQDFHAAVQQGDPGSADDLGRVKLGILEPAPEYVLFSLPVAGVGGPVDTPRGYWIVKRLE
jgi:hypothetical protein